MNYMERLDNMLESFKETLSKSEYNELSGIIENQEKYNIFDRQSSMIRNKLENKATEQQLRQIMKQLKLNYDNIYD